MVRAAVWLAACAFTMSAVSAFAQAGPKTDLPMAPTTPLQQVVPGLGATPGVILIQVDPGAPCAANAAKAAEGAMAPAEAIGACNEAIKGGIIPPDGLPEVFVNRGVILMMMERPDDALRDFDRALALQPDLAEALVNRGAILIAQGRQREGVAELTRGLALGPEQPERAYLNRGRGREDLKDIRGAYDDYRMADTLRPGWQPVLDELKRFQVR